jgi:acyl-CoA synthetase (AMP-forming)/AMP-acid ligase II
MTFKTLYEVVKHSVEKFSSRIAFTMIDTEDVSYKEVGERIEDVQEKLLNAGVGAGDKVAILSSSMPNWGVSYFAVTTAGMIAVPILPDFTSEEQITLFATVLAIASVFAPVTTHSKSLVAPSPSPAIFLQRNTVTVLSAFIKQAKSSPSSVI